MIRDVTGLTLDEAAGLLETAGVKVVSIKLTAPPRERDRQYGPDSRVVRQLVRRAESGAEEAVLVVCNPQPDMKTPKAP